MEERVVTCEDGLEMDVTLRSSGYTWLEKQYGAPLSVVVKKRWPRQGGMSAEDGILFTAALIRQRYPSMTDAEARDAARKHQWELIVALGKLGNIGYDVFNENCPMPPAGADGPVTKVQVLGAQMELDEKGDLRFSEEETPK
jgi:hypothetical protein